MNNEQDALALLLANAQRKRWHAYPLTAVSQVSAGALDDAAAVLAAGYRKPRTITTIEELDALPKRSVIRDDFGGVFQRQTKFVWTRQNRDFDYEADDIELPATVLYEPEALP